VTSSPVGFLLAVPPGQPQAGPIIASSSSQAITVTFASNPATGSGSPITGYHLQYMAALTVGLWQDVVGHDSDSLRTSYTLSGLTKGETYYFRHRVKSSQGWGAYSATTSTVAADAPGKPMAPTVNGDPTATTVALDFDLASIDDGGSPIT
jgi:hypothetical protein